MLPEPNHFESYVTEKLRRQCPNCTVAFDPAHLCASALSALGNLTDEDLKSKGEAASAFARVSLANRAVLADMHATLEHLASSGVPFPTGVVILAEGGGHIDLNGRRLNLITCDGLKELHKERLGEGKAWQVEEWYDGNCNFKNTGYLSFVSI
jgi:hypothetical protein